MIYTFQSKPGLVIETVGKYFILFFWLHLFLYAWDSSQVWASFINTDWNVHVKLLFVYIYRYCYGLSFVTSLVGLYFNFNLSSHPLPHQECLLPVFYFPITVWFD